MNGAPACPSDLSGARPGVGIVAQPRWPGSSVPPSRRTNFTNFSSKSIFFATDGNQFNAAAPLLKRVTSFKFGTVPAGVFLLSMQSSILNPSSGIAAIYAARDQGPTISLDNSADIWLGNLTHQNSSGGSATPCSRVNTMSLGATSTLNFNSGQAIGLYVCCDNSNTVLLSASLQVFWIPLVGAPS